jgi:hypothetical protein
MVSPSFANSTSKYSTSSSGMSPGLDVSSPSSPPSSSPPASPPPTAATPPPPPPPHAAAADRAVHRFGELRLGHGVGAVLEDLLRDVLVRGPPRPARVVQDDGDNRESQPDSEAHSADCHILAAKETYFNSLVIVLAVRAATATAPHGEFDGRSRAEVGDPSALGRRRTVTVRIRRASGCASRRRSLRGVRRR